MKPITFYVCDHCRVTFRLAEKCAEHEVACAKRPDAPKAEPKPHHGHRWMPALYVTYFGMLTKVANAHGYALAVHGTVDRDLDVVAIPWVETPSSHDDLLVALDETIGYEFTNEPYSSKAEKPGGRMAYTLPLGSGGYLDISITPFVGQDVNLKNRYIEQSVKILRLLHEEGVNVPAGTMELCDSMMVMLSTKEQN